MITHSCSICGSSRAYYGYNVRLLQGKPGFWRCYEHTVDKMQTFESASKKATVKPEKLDAPKPAAKEKQGSLF